MKNRLFRVIGLMSGTSLDAIDVALIETDGVNEVAPLASSSYPYEKGTRDLLRGCLGIKSRDQSPMAIEAERTLTLLHADAVQQFLNDNLLTSDAIDLIGFHGQTVWHSPEQRQTLQLGDGALLAQKTGIDVINDFRSADVAAGGEGAPLVPLYHRALSSELAKPLSIVNIGGVSNMTWIGGSNDDEILAFDLGPGNALLDDWMLAHTGKPYDESGLMASNGKAKDEVIACFLRHPFFLRKPPKSLDRDAFVDFVPHNLSAEDGAATLTLITVWSIVRGMDYLPQKPKTIYLTGGGRHNLTIIKWLEELSGIPVDTVDSLGWSGDALEAEAFAYLAVRSSLGLPITLPMTTGVKFPQKGGQRYQA